MTASIQHGLTRRGVLISGLCAAFAAGPLWAGQRPDSDDPEFWRDQRSVRVRNANTNQSGEFLIWRDGNYVMDGYVDLCYMLRDHHENKALQLQPGLFDLMYATQRWYEGATGRKAATTVTSGYRTDNTNALVGGVPGGLHPKGDALDGALDGVDPGVYARMLLTFGVGGVGLYAHHVHWDVRRKPAFWRGGQRES